MVAPIHADSILSAQMLTQESSTHSSARENGLGGEMLVDGGRLVGHSSALGQMETYSRFKKTRGVSTYYSCCLLLYIPNGCALVGKGTLPCMPHRLYGRIKTYRSEVFATSLASKASKKGAVMHTE